MIDTNGRHIVVTGAMGVGKTTVGRLLAEKLGMPFHDSDTALEARTGETGAQIAVRDGVDRLHQIELDVFLDMCLTSMPAVLAPASSVVDHEEGRRAMRENITIWLTAPDHVISSRQGEDTHRRVMGETERGRLRVRREPWLRRLSATSIETGDLSPAEVVDELIQRL